MTPNRGRNLIALIREYARLEAEVKSLASVLNYVETEGHLPIEGWLATLKDMRETPQYRTISERYEPLLLHAEQTVDLAEVESLLEKLPTARILNLGAPAMNLHDVAQVFATEDDAHEALIKARWPKGVRCVACDSDRISRVRSSGKTGKVRRVLECLACGYQFTATSGTLFHDSHLPLHKWFMAIALLCEAKKSFQLCNFRGIWASSTRPRGT